mmetsp:Transcript_4633/g.13759  ORF Transcript_4633/g.13759 Transcript_4633/m.13759 type:complete len:89 (+) Transcript_4633:590-856(+)
MVVSSFANASSKSSRGAEATDTAELKDRVFQLFEKETEYSFKELVGALRLPDKDQPALRRILREVCEMGSEGPRGVYRLKPEWVVAGS